MSVWLAAFSIVIAVSLGLSILLRIGIATRLAVDTPNERSLHTSPTPRIGGLVMLPCVLVAWLVIDSDLDSLAALAALLGVVSYVDDRHDLPVLWRLGAHLAASVSAVFVLDVVVPWWGTIALVLAVVWMTNLYNFMDGSDGLAGGMTLFGFGTLALAAYTTDAFILAVPCTFLAAGALGFLMLNYPPARVFLGDVGSVPLGFLAGTLGMVGVVEEAWPVWLPLMAFAPFIADATLTLGRRLLRKEKVWRAHRQHTYQRMVRLGYGHAGTALRWYSVMLAGSVAGLLVLQFPAAIQWIVVIAWYAMLAGLSFAIERRWRQQAEKAGM